MKTIVWFRSDLRINDHPALSAAAEAGEVIPVFILNAELLKGRHSSSNRNRFLLECLEDLQTSLRKLSSDLIIRDGDPAATLLQLVKQTGAEQVFCTVDYTPFSINRDKKVKDTLAQEGIALRLFPGRLAVDKFDAIRTKTGNVHKVFTPFWKNWVQIDRRPLAKPPAKLNSVKDVSSMGLPALPDITNKDNLSPKVWQGGEAAARQRLKLWLDEGVEDYPTQHHLLREGNTSQLSPYLHLGCLSVREIEDMLPDTKGARSWHRQLAWREFYHYILFNFPSNAKQEFQQKYQQLKWGNDKKLLTSWEKGQTGYPIVDAAMRQLNLTGWMHNRGRLIVGSFLTKDLWLDWRLGEAYFMKMLVDGDDANNNGNWQWITSVGVDPAPVYRRLYNPTLQAQKFDPDGSYVRKFVPELANVPDKLLNTPWEMTPEQQKEAGCIIGKDYPAPIVDHKQARLATLERYNSVN